MTEKTYIVSNLSKKVRVKTKIEVAKTKLEQTRGLMFRNKIVPMLFVFPKEGNYPIHSFFVPDKFDAVYLSKSLQVQEIFRAIPPNTWLVVPSKKSKFLLELPCELSLRLKIEVADILGLEEC